MVIGDGNAIILNASTVTAAIREYLNKRLAPDAQITVLSMVREDAPLGAYRVIIKHVVPAAPPQDRQPDVSGSVTGRASGGSVLSELPQNISDWPVGGSNA